ncbi:unnamed protein product [Cladocopium goreaui]|uniref:Uncharacterized protein n=1 Tax=Cladocopium goreaui TaxID=2562237 RepID=A0A9P1CTT5_9DINO|nr:unnamed protein product [Cladocopium goreaui]
MVRPPAMTFLELQTWLIGLYPVLADEESSWYYLVLNLCLFLDFDYSVIDIFGGVGSLSQAAGSGFVFDVRRDPRHNCHEKVGLQILGDACARTKHHGLALCQPTCSSFLRFVSTHTSKRTLENLYGDESMEFVATGNATAELVATVLVPLCDWLGLYWVCENPMNSLFFVYPSIDAVLQALLDTVPNGQITRTIVWLRTFGAASGKPLELRGRWGGFVYLQEIHRRAWGPTRGRRTAPIMDRGSKWVTGNKSRLASSSAYPRAFGAALWKAHQAYLANNCNLVLSPEVMHDLHAFADDMVGNLPPEGEVALPDWRCIKHVQTYSDALYIHMCAFYMYVCMYVCMYVYIYT